jgi:hypothetical protein
MLLTVKAREGRKCVSDTAQRQSCHLRESVLESSGPNVLVLYITAGFGHSALTAAITHFR